MTNCGMNGSIELRLFTTRNKKLNERPASDGSLCIVRFIIAVVSVKHNNVRLRNFIRGN